MVMAPVPVLAHAVRAGAQRGFTYLALLLALALSATALAAAGVVWHTETQRAQEAELLFIGGEFGRAIASFYNATPGPVKQLPKRLEDLLRDTRYPTLRRHLRKIYVDPITGKAEWGIVATPAGISGVYSLSARQPFRNRSAPAVAAVANTSGAAPAAVPGAVPGAAPVVLPVVVPMAKYSDWKFVAAMEQAPAAAPGAPAASAAPSQSAAQPAPVASQTPDPSTTPPPAADLINK
jgi:type II secretory pathway pseudopilin PulG